MSHRMQLRWPSLSIRSTVLVAIIVGMVFARVLPLEMQKRVVNEAINLRDFDLLLLYCGIYLVAVIFAHICYLLACRNCLALCNQPLVIMGIGTEQLFVVLDDHQFPVANQATAAVNDFTRS